MTSGQDLITNNFRQAECNFYSAGTEIAQGVAIGSLLTAQYWGTIGASAVGLAFMAAADLAGCNHDPGNPEQEEGVQGCKETSAGLLNLNHQSSTDPDGYGIVVSLVKGIVSTNVIYDHDTTIGGTVYDAVEWTVIDRDGNQESGKTRIPASERPLEPLFTSLWPDAECAEEFPTPEPLPPDAIGRPTEITDGDCVWTFTPTDSFIDGRGFARVYYEIKANNDACGGPFGYWSGPDGPTPVVPTPDGEDPIPPEPPPQNCPDPCPDPTPAPTPTLGGTTYQLRGICEDVPEGQDQPIYQFQTPGGPYYNELAERIDQLANMLQQHLALKTPVCPPTRPAKQGEFRTISFVSDEKSPNGNDRVHKRLRYRSVSGIGLAGVVDHWRAFTWQAGPVCVSHKGAYWGTPQVWAATAEEGKRVIRHAAVEAGLDPDQTGGWVVSGSDNPRYGMPGTMRVNTKGGYYWITERLGSDARPQVEQI